MPVDSSFWMASNPGKHAARHNHTRLWQRRDSLRDMRIWLLLLCLSTAAVQGPQIFAPGSISDAREQWRITFTPDGLTAYFAESEQFFPISRKATIYTSVLRDGVWTAPVVAPFSGTHSDIDPFITPDGQRLYFSSIRPVNGTTRGDIDIWMVERTAQGWSDPVPLGPEVNTPDDELYPSASADGTIYFASGPAAPASGKHYDIYRARRAGNGFAKREALGPGHKHHASARPIPGRRRRGSSTLRFRPTGPCSCLRRCVQAGTALVIYMPAAWSAASGRAAENLGPAVNTAADEYHPTLSRDRKQLYFVRRGPGARRLLQSCPRLRCRCCRGSAR